MEAASEMLAGSRDLARGATFGGYLVRDRIGRGGMATVYRAEHRLLEKPVALKVMDRSLLATGDGLQRFLLEGRAVAAIQHPNVVDITDVGVHDGVPFLVMELLTGKDLAAHLLEHRMLDNASVVRIALPVVAALHAAHTSGVVHRDVKPSNIFLSVGADQQLVPKVLDFGISKMSFDSATIDRMMTPQHHIIGTPQYLSPEALRGASEMGPLSDQYSLGVVLYQCVTGRTPFGGDSLIALLESLSRGSFEPPRAVQPEVSPGLERIILRALSPRPSDRFPTLHDMGRALIELAAERTQVVWGQSFKTPLPGATPATGSERSGARAPARSSPFFTARPEPPRWRRIALGLGLLLGGALGLLMWSTLTGSSSVPRDPSSRAVPPQQAAAVLPAAVDALEPSTQVLALKPARTEPPSSASEAAPGESNEASRASPPSVARAALPSSRPTTVSASARAKARARARLASSKKGARSAKGKKARAASARASSEPSRPSAPREPRAPAPLIGANGAPLLD